MNNQLYRKTHAKPGPPKVLAQLPAYRAMYILKPIVALSLNGNYAKIALRTRISAGQFKARYLGGGKSKRIVLTINGTLGFFYVFSDRRVLLEKLPEEFGSFKKSAIDRWPVARHWKVARELD